MGEKAGFSCTDKANVVEVAFIAPLFRLRATGNCELSSVCAQGENENDASDCPTFGACACSVDTEIKTNSLLLIIQSRVRLSHLRRLQHSDHLPWTP